MKKFLSLIIRGAIITFLVIVIIVCAILKNNVEICENLTRTLSRFLNSISSKISNIFPFSLTELAFMILVIGSVILLVVGIIQLTRRKIISSFNRFLEIAAIILLSITAYDLSCEFAYNRKEMPLPYYENKINREEHVDIYNYFADDLNDCISQLEFEDNGELIAPLSFKKTVEEVKKSYAIIEGNDYFASYFGSVKPMASSFIYREFQIVGVTYSPFGEANINYLNTNADLPITIAHELAHTKGVMREEDANLLSFYICLNSEHPYLRYSAYNRYFGQMQSIVTSTYLYDEEKANVHPINASYYKCLNYESAYWSKHDLLGDIGNFINDLYLKSSGVKEGTTSYDGGSYSEPDPEKKELKIVSQYQKLYFEKYYRH